MDDIVSIGMRLRLERERKGLSQEAFGLIGGVGKKAQFNYEKGERSPDAEYLAKLVVAGVDVGFVLTGKPSSSVLNKDETELLILFREASLEMKAAAIGMLKTGNAVSGTTSSVQQVFHGSVGQSNTGDGYYGDSAIKAKIEKDKKK